MRRAKTVTAKWLPPRVYQCDKIAEDYIGQFNSWSEPKYMQESFVNFDWPLPLRFFLALAISFLVGLERESSAIIRKPKVFAGVRTYSLVGVYGFGCAWLYNNHFEWALPIGMISVTVMVIVNYLAKLKEGQTGWTSEIAALLTFIIGVLCLVAEIWIPMALGIVGTFLLSEKSNIERFVKRLDENEFLAVLKFLLVTIIILPVLPHQNFTEYNLNPRKIWQIVVLVSSVGFVGYFLSKKYGSRVGLWLSGLLGGIVSSTAVSIACGRIAQGAPERSVNALQASLLASSVMYIRVLILIWILAPEMTEHFWLKLILLAGVGLALSFSVRTQPNHVMESRVESLHNPFEIKPALVFAAMFVLMSVITSLVTQFYGNAGMIALAFITGVTDIDPFILSLVEHVDKYHMLIVTAVIVAMMSNTIAKGLYFGTLAKTARIATAWRFALWAALHIPIILWPTS